MLFELITLTCVSLNRKQLKTANEKKNKGEFEVWIPDPDVLKPRGNRWKGIVPWKWDEHLPSAWGTAWTWEGSLGQSVESAEQHHRAGLALHNSYFKHKAICFYKWYSCKNFKFICSSKLKTWMWVYTWDFRKMLLEVVIIAFISQDKYYAK